MRIDTLYVRFFRSFNYDYLRKGDPESEPDPWDTIEEKFYPYVKVPLEAGITTVVGANESGKSQLLAAIQSLLTGEGMETKDFCRYSTFFSVGKELSKPEFGGRFVSLSPEDKEELGKIFSIQSSAGIESFYLFRTNRGVFIYIDDGKGFTHKKIDAAQCKKLKLPTFFHIHSDIPLPDSVPLEYLTEAKNAKIAKSRRKMLRGQEEMRLGLEELLSGQPQAFQNFGTKFNAAFRAEGDDENNLPERLALAETLLVQVAGIDRSAFKDLQVAVKQSEGYANSLVDKMNQQLAEKLNFSKWWSQDKDFALYLTLRDFDLVFTVKDRTGSNYSFGERSDGMKYFLSYFVQYLSYRPKSDFEVLLMDEPDRFLSTSGQQDLLRIFAQFAKPDDPSRKGVQVVYVTHSPFLIDKNHGERIRVLEKGDDEEGTRVVKNAARNHYEPLRSAFGAFVAETTFISNCNLMLEGQADQVLLAGISTYIRENHPSKPSLDLNELTLVPSGSAEHIPYMVYLARGRDVDQPALVVLLDGDDEADSIRKELKKGYRDRKFIDDDLVISVNDLSSRISANETILEIEDLIPTSIAKEAVRRVGKIIFNGEDYKIFKEKLKEIDPKAGEKIFKAASRAAKEASPDSENPLRLDKVAFARAVVETLEDKKSGTDQLVDNFSALFDLISERQRLATRRNNKDKSTKIMKRLRSAFLSDNRYGAKKVDVQGFLENIEEHITDITEENEAIRDRIRKIRVEHNLGIDPQNLVTDFEGLKQQIEAMTYEAVRQSQQG